VNGKQAIEHVEHTLDGKSVRPTLEILNKAGEYLVGMRPWKWLQGATASVDFVASQSYADLPSGLLRIIAADMADGFVSRLEPVSLQTLLELRVANLGTQSVYYWALSHHQAGSGGGAPTPRMELWPTPTSNETGAITVFYVSGWATIDDENDQLSIPRWIEGLYIQVLRAYARGWEMEDLGSLEDRLSVVRGSTLFRQAADIDQTFQGTVGVIRNGAVQSLYGRRRGSWWDVSISGVGP
jgi:hypothetical protein